MDRFNVNDIQLDEVKFKETEGNVLERQAELPREDTQPVDQTTNEKPTPDNEVKEPLSDQPSFKDLTQGQFEKPEDLWSQYQNLLKEKDSVQTQEDPLAGDEDWKKFREAYEAGVLDEYLKVSSIDYSKMSDEEILRMDLAAQWEGLEPDQKKKAVDLELRKRYGIGEDEDDVDEMAQLRLLRDAKKVRDEMIKKQGEFKIPERKVEDKPDNPAASLPPELEKKLREQADFLTNSPKTKDFFETGKLSVKYGDADPYNIEVTNKEDVLSILNGEKSLMDAVATENGYDLDRLYKALAYMADPESFEKSLIVYGKNLGTDTVLDTIENPSKGDPVSKPDPGEGDVLAKALGAFSKSYGR